MSKTLHQGTSFLITTDSGEIDPAKQRGSGLFYEDSRFLSLYRLSAGGLPLIGLTTYLPSDEEAFHYLVNPKIPGIDQDKLSIVRRQILQEGFQEELSVQSFADRAVEVEFKFELASDFEDIFLVKQAIEQTGRAIELPRHQVKSETLDNQRGLRYILQKDGIFRETIIAFSQKPDSIAPSQCSFHVRLEREEIWRLSINAGMSADSESLPVVRTRTRTQREESKKRANRRAGDIGEQMHSLETDHPILEEAFQRAAADIISLRITSEEVGPRERAIAAGMPWYMALFGRDSLIASYQSMYVDPSLAEGTLRALARLQGKRLDKQSQEAPGKILHEYRQGKIFGTYDMIPKFPYYGTIDATELFLVLLSEYVRFTGNLQLARDLWPHVNQALDWIRDYGDIDGDGFLEYELCTRAGLKNQGWKDSSDSIRFRNGSIAEPPIALVEVQGYTVDAFLRIAELCRHLGEEQRARELESAAARLRASIRKFFWMDDLEFPAEALDRNKIRVDSVTSNPGHLLWSGALDDGSAKDVAKRLLSPAMFSGFGIRTMAAGEGGFNPVSYHNGSVWPHENALIVDGLMRYGFKNAAAKVVEALLSTLAHYPDRRFPELFTGFDQKETTVPVEYPSACRPQAWASGATLLLVRCILGLRVNVLSRELSCDPLPIKNMSWLKLKNLRIGQLQVDIDLTISNGKASASIRNFPEGWKEVA